MKIVFMGTPNFTIPTLEALNATEHEIIALVCQPDKPQGRKKEIIFCDAKKWAIKHNIPVLQPEKIREDFQAVLDLKPDLIVTAAYGQIIPNEILEAPKYGCVNVHGSLLPKYRGGAPVHWSVINGDAETGVTIMYMAEKMDAGDIIHQVVVPINVKDKTYQVYDNVANAGAIGLIEALPKIFDENFVATPQVEEEVTFAFNIKKEDEEIDFNLDVIQCYNRARGLINWPCGYIIKDGKRIKIIDVEHNIINSNKTPGELFALENKLFLQCANGAFQITKIQLEGKKQTDDITFINGYLK